MEYIFLWFVCMMIGASVRGSSGFIWTFFLGPLGLIISLMKEKEKSSLSKKDKLELEMFKLGQKKKCTYCLEDIHKDATICKYCRSEIKVEKSNNDYKKCTYCGKRNPIEALICSKCHKYI